MNYLIVTVFLLLFACENTDEKPANTDIVPLTIGTKWVHQITTQFPIYRVFDQSQEVVDIDSTGYSSIYTSSDNILSIYYYKNKSDGLYRLFSNNFDSLILKYPLKLSESYISNQGLVTLANTDTGIIVDAGEFDSYLYNYEQNNQIVQQRFYAIGVGLIKQIYYSNDGSVSRLVELKSFMIK